MAEPLRLILPERADAPSWPKQGQWTYEDYRHLPADGQRYEVVRGHLYVSPAPSYRHQATVGELFWQLSQFVRSRQLGQVLAAPFDVLLPGGLATPVQPDLMFFRTDNRPRPGDLQFRGVPDLVVEVLSPGTRQLDRAKLATYRDAGVPEVWHADPRTRTLVRYTLNAGGTDHEQTRGGEGDVVASRVLPGLQLDVREVFASSRE